ncbi:hypothetical protein QF001_006615 [Paraburkholderia youngii]
MASYIAGGVNAPPDELAWASSAYALVLLFIAQLIANLTFRIFAIEEFTYGYRLKNIVWQLTISFATASVIIIEQHRLALHQSRLAESVNPYNSVY